MGRRRMTRTLPPNASAFTDRHGHTRVRFRRAGHVTVYARHRPGTDEFMAEYMAWRDGLGTAVGPHPDSMDALIESFYRSAAWASIPAESTRTTYRGELQRFRRSGTGPGKLAYGERSVNSYTAARIAQIVAGMADRPSAANNLLKRLRQIFDHAILLGKRTDNPAMPVRSIPTKGGFVSWSEEEIARFEARHPVGTKARLALALFLYTAQRRSDVATMGPQHIRNGRLQVRQLKTGKVLSIPMHPDLKRIIGATEAGHLAFIVSERGAPFTKESFGAWFRKRCDEADLPTLAAHGLRKAASRRLAEAGATNQQIKAWTGHSSDQEVARYTRAADQEKLADSAVGMMGAPLLATPLATHQKKGRK